jgi:hypothetical protein
MNRSKAILIFLVISVSAVMTILTMYFYGAWQHERYWNGTIAKINEIESSVYVKLLSTDLNKIYSGRDFDKLREIFRPLDGKLIIRINDSNGSTVFESSKARYELGPILQQTQFDSDLDMFTVQIISYRPPSWNSQYVKWFSHYAEWLTVKYDFITTPSIFFFLIWCLFITALIWRYKAHLESDRLFHVLHEFRADNNEEERK